jgi:hypothetical protein
MRSHAPFPRERPARPLVRFAPVASKVRLPRKREARLVALLREHVERALACVWVAPKYRQIGAGHRVSR